MKGKKRILRFECCILMMFLLVAMATTVFAASPKHKKATPPIPMSAMKKIALLPILEAEEVDSESISQILTNEVLDFAQAHQATFIGEDVLLQAIKRSSYPDVDNGKPIDLNVVKTIQQETGADLVIAIRVLSLEQSSVEGNSSLFMNQAKVKMELTAATASQPLAWGKKVDNKVVVNYATDQELGMDRAAANELKVFLNNAWRKL